MYRANIMLMICVVGKYLNGYQGDSTRVKSHDFPETRLNFFFPGQSMIPQYSLQSQSLLSNNGSSGQELQEGGP